MCICNTHAYRLCTSTITVLRACADTLKNINIWPATREISHNFFPFKNISLYGNSFYRPIYKLRHICVTLCHLYRTHFSGDLVAIIINLASSSIHTHDREREIDDTKGERHNGTTDAHSGITEQYNWGLKFVRFDEISCYAKLNNSTNIRKTYYSNEPLQEERNCHYYLLFVLLLTQTCKQCFSLYTVKTEG